MNKLVCFLMLTVLSFIMVGCAATGDDQETTVSKNNTGCEYVENLTLEDVTAAIGEAGIELTEIPGAGQTLRLNEVTPSAFSVNRTEETMLIYVCPSIAIRTIINPYPFGWNREADDDCLSITKNCKNVLIIDKVPVANKRGLGAYDFDRWTRLQEAALKLNDAKETVFCGRSAHWAAKVMITHYSHLYQNKYGTPQYDNYYRDTWEARYLGSYDEVEEVSYSILRPSGSCSRAPTFVDKDGYVQFSGHGGDDMVGDSDVYRLTLNWNGHKETICLKKR